MLDPQHEDGASGSAPHETTDCCRPPDPRIGSYFDQRMRDAAAAGALPEMVDVSRGLLELLGDISQERPTVLEIGSGSGALAVALLERGAARADGVDLSPESVATARRRADDSGVGSRAEFRVGDGAQVQLEQHDWVVLDRVICCYPHVDHLLSNSMGAAGRRYAFSVPHVSGWRGIANWLEFTAESLIDRLRGRPCPAYLHDIGMIERRLAAAGFRRLRQKTIGRWYAAVFERAATDSGQIARSDSVS